VQKVVKNASDLARKEMKTVANHTNASIKAEGTIKAQGKTTA